MIRVLFAHINILAGIFCTFIWSHMDPIENKMAYLKGLSLKDNSGAK